MRYRITLFPGNDPCSILKHKGSAGSMIQLLLFIFTRRGLATTGWSGSSWRDHSTLITGRTSPPETVKVSFGWGAHNFITTFNVQIYQVGTSDHIATESPQPHTSTDPWFSSLFNKFSASSAYASKANWQRNIKRRTPMMDSSDWDC